jgi:DNA-directed RNA polymerase subunit RPC12/RpoP
MIPLRYTLVRWVILVIGVILAASLYYFYFPLGIRMLLCFLLVLTAMSLIVPPGIFGWLVRAVCPTCGKPVEWAAVQPEGMPCQEQIVVRCPGCGKSKVEWQYLPT